MRYWTVLALGIGCGADGGGDVTLDGHSHPTDTDSSAMTADCDGADPFVAGVTAPTARGTVTITEAAPTPPDVGDNAWKLDIADGDGPAEGLVVEVVPWMPLHGHGLVPPEYAATDAGGGRYEVAPFDLIMPGLWEFTVTISLDGVEVVDEAAFAFCAEG